MISGKAEILSATATTQKRGDACTQSHCSCALTSSAAQSQGRLRPMDLIYIYKSCAKISELDQQFPSVAPGPSVSHDPTFLGSWNWQGRLGYIHQRLSKLLLWRRSAAQSPVHPHLWHLEIRQQPLWPLSLEATELDKLVSIYRSSAGTPSLQKMLIASFGDGGGKHFAILNWLLILPSLFSIPIKPNKAMADTSCFQCKKNPLWPSTKEQSRTQESLFGILVDVLHSSQLL